MKNLFLFLMLIFSVTAYANCTVTLVNCAQNSITSWDVTYQDEANDLQTVTSENTVIAPGEQGSSQNPNYSNCAYFTISNITFSNGLVRNICPRPIVWPYSEAVFVLNSNVDCGLTTVNAGC